MNEKILCLGTFFCLLCAGCNVKPLTARSEVVDCEDLASYYVNSPDPRLCGYYGQQIIIEWNLPNEKWCQPDLKIVLSMITSKHQYKTVCFPIHTQLGTYTYRLLNQSLSENGAVLTYKVEVYSEDRLLECWKQQGWVEWIDLSS